MYFDSHIHLSHRSYDDTFSAVDGRAGYHIIPQITREELIQLSKDSHIGLFLDPGIDLESNYKLLALNSKYPDTVLPAVGIHPTRAPRTPFRDRKILKKMSLDPRVVAIGELGLDFHYDRKDQHRFKQYCWFIWQLSLAHKRQLPLVLHIRMAHNEAISVLRKYKNKLHGGVCHCFKGNAAEAHIYTRELGFMLGIGGSLLQASDHLTELEEAVYATPLEYLLLETDGPYVSPSRPVQIPKSQWRKGNNTSLILPQVASRIAEIKGLTLEEVVETTTRNGIRLFL